MEKHKIIENVIVLLLLIALCVYIIVVSAGFKSTAGIMPRLIAYVTGGLCCIELGNELRRLYVLRQSGETSENAVKEPLKENRLLWASAMLIAYFVLVLVVGFYIATLIYLAGTMVLFGFRKKLSIVLICAGMTIFMYVLFEQLLYVKLPNGMFF